MTTAWIENGKIPILHKCQCSSMKVADIFRVIFRNFGIWKLCVMHVTAVPDAVRLLGTIEYGNTTTEKPRRGGRCCASFAEHGRTPADWQIWPWDTGADDEATMRCPGRLRSSSHTLCWSRELHTEQWTMAQNQHHLPVGIWLTVSVSVVWLSSASLALSLSYNLSLCDLEYEGATVGYCQLSWLLVLISYWF